jgi:exosome complex component RRP43
MASQSTKQRPPPTTTFPPEVFALFDPPAYLHQHLLKDTRPSTRAPSAFPPPIVNASPLTHSFGSCVARSGDTSAVAGVRAEILDVKNIPNPPADDADDVDKIRQLGLLVPNVEFATGSGKKFLPGGAPGTLAQAVTWKVLDLLLQLDMIDLRELEIRSLDKSSMDSGSDLDQSQPSEKVIAYWTLYLDITLISYTGSLMPTIWAALLGALRTTKLPYTYYSLAHDVILCSSRHAPAPLKVTGMPIISTFRVFEPSRHKGLAAKCTPGQSWILAEPDELEEEICGEAVMVVVDCSDVSRGTRLRRIEKGGGGIVGRGRMREEIVKMATTRWFEWNAALEEIAI